MYLKFFNSSPKSLTNRTTFVPFSQPNNNQSINMFHNDISSLNGKTAKTTPVVLNFLKVTLLTATIYKLKEVDFN